MDTRVFSAGIGENSPVIRSWICSGLESLGLRLDERLNQYNSPVISADDSVVVARVLHTDEELMIARDVLKLVDKESIR